MPVHNSTIGLDWSPDDLIVFFEVDDDDLGLSLLAELLADTNPGIGLKRLARRLGVVMVLTATGTYT